MKILYTLSLILISIAGWAQTNLLSFNGGFEDNDLGWSEVVDDWLYKRWGESTMYTDRNNTAAHTGNFGVSINIVSTGGSGVAGMAGIRRTVTGMSANTTYSLKFFIKAEQSGNQEVIVSVGDYMSNPSVNIAQQSLTYTGGSWQEVEMVFNTDVAANYSQIRFDIDFRSNAGQYFVDDFSLVQTVVKTPQSIDFAPLAKKEVGDPDFTLHAAASSGLAISYASSNTTVATVTDSTVTVLSDGITYITASQGGDATYEAAPDVTRMLWVVDSTKLFQTITFDNPGDQVYGQSALALAATTDAPLSVTYVVVSGPATLSGNLISFTGVGPVTVRAEAAGDNTYNVAMPVSQTFNVLKADQTITIEAIPDLGLSARPYSIVASASSGLQLTFEVSGPATLSGANVAPAGSTGKVVLRAIQAGNELYNSATDSVTFNIVSCDTPGANCFDGTFYVAKWGDDSNPGTADEPFLTIQKAADEMLEGEACVIHEGVYRESVRPKSNGVTFSAAAGEKVVLSGYDTIATWQLYTGSIYKASVPASLGDQNMVMYDGKIMNLARWPNKTDFNPFDLEAASGAAGTLTSLSLADIPDQDFEQGGVLWFLGKNSWSSWRQPITGNTAGSITYNQLPSDWYFAGALSPETGGEFILYNTLKALDSNGEWYFDDASNILYFQAPDGGDLSGKSVEVRQRTQLIDISGLQNVTVDGLRMIGGNVNMKGSSVCHILNCEVLYGNHTLGVSGSKSQQSFRPNIASISMDNNSMNNIVERCNIQWGAATGILLSGQGNIIRNNYIGNFDYMGAYSAPIRLSGQNVIEGNEIFNGGRDLINGGGNGAEIGYNDMYASNLIDDDCGAIYMCCGKFGNTRIHHNWIHDIFSRDEAFIRHKGADVYLDNSTEDVTVDHNVMWNLEWTGVQINWAGVNQLIYNNTIWNTDGVYSQSMGRWVNGYELTNVVVYNTLANDAELLGTDIDKSVSVTSGVSPFIDFEHRNFMPNMESPAVDAGRVIDGFTDGYIGDAPDAGAYERGKNYWIPGPDWVPEGQMETDCNGEAGGSAFIDKCGNCVGGNTGLSQESGDCPKKNNSVILGLGRSTQLLVHPNPASNYVSLNGVAAFSEYVITDLKGRNIQSGVIRDDELYIKLKANLQGCYLLRLHNENTEKVIKLILQ